MPIYEYQCCDCRKQFETLVFRSDEAVSCPDCGCSHTERLMSVCGFKSGGAKGAASSRMGSSASSCSGCSSGNCASCH